MATSSPILAISTPFSMLLCYSICAQMPTFGWMLRADSERVSSILPLGEWDTIYSGEEWLLYSPCWKWWMFLQNTCGLMTSYTLLKVSPLTWHANTNVSVLLESKPWWFDMGLVHLVLDLTFSLYRVLLKRIWESWFNGWSWEAHQGRIEGQPPCHHQKLSCHPKTINTWVTDLEHSIKRLHVFCPKV